MQPRRDVSGVLSAIDHALSGTAGPDSMRWAPPAACSVTFTWDEDAETGSAAFAGVSRQALESLRPGMPVTVDGRRCVITYIAEDDVRGFMIDLRPE